jgi:hypothetical protein
VETSGQSKEVESPRCERPLVGGSQRDDDIVRCEAFRTIFTDVSQANFTGRADHEGRGQREFGRPSQAVRIHAIYGERVRRQFIDDVKQLRDADADIAQDWKARLVGLFGPSLTIR